MTHPDFARLSTHWAVAPMVLEGPLYAGAGSGCSPRQREPCWR